MTLRGVMLIGNQQVNDRLQVSLNIMSYLFLSILIRFLRKCCQMKLFCEIVSLASYYILRKSVLGHSVCSDKDLIRHLC